MDLNEARSALAALAPARRRPGRVTLELDGGVAHLRIDNPEARGALTVSMMVDLADAVTRLRGWDGALVVLSSTDPRAFCAGGHLGEVGRAVDGPAAAIAMATAMATVLDGLLDLPAVSVAAIDGLALGGGAELCTACDFRVAGPQARIHFVQSRLGIAPGWGATARLVRLVGRRVALRILTSARPMTAGEGQTLGLVDHRCDGAATDGALTWLEDLRGLAPESVRALKRQVVAASPAERDPAGEASAFASVWGGPAHRAALEGLERHRR